MITNHTIELPRKAADLFKGYLRSQGIQFWPSEAGNLIHISVAVTTEQAADANNWLNKNIA